MSKDTDIKEVHRKDSDILSYLLIYLLPFIRSDTSVIASQPITTFACIFIILLVTANVGAFHVNPVLSILGFRVYSISTENSDGILIANSKDVLYGYDITLRTVTLSQNFKIYIHTRSMNV